ncbi:MAG: acyl-CoA dehydrogenase family protein [Nitrospinota bacterium]|nr:acyl-CoA dehydrogenase family protein [Nitrospinota bacterium]
MDFELNEAQRLLKETAAEFAATRIAPVARQNDIDGRFPAGIVEETGALGFFGGVIPEAYGGAGMDYISYAVLMEEISKACSSVRTVLSVQMSLVSSTILKWGSGEQKRKYLPRLCSAEWLGCLGLTEPDVGSDAQHIRSFAEKTNGGWRLDGRKIWISNGGLARLALVIAQTDRENPRRMAAFLIETDTPGFTSKNTGGKLGLRSSNTAELYLDGVEVPDEALLGEVGDGFKVAMSAAPSANPSRPINSSRK